MLTCFFCSVWTWHALAKAFTGAIVGDAWGGGDEGEGDGPPPRVSLEYREIMQIPKHVLGEEHEEVRRLRVSQHPWVGWVQWGGPPFPFSLL